MTDDILMAYLLKTDVAEFLDAHLDARQSPSLVPKPSPTAIASNVLDPSNPQTLPLPIKKHKYKPHDYPPEATDYDRLKPRPKNYQYGRRRGVTGRLMTPVREPKPFFIANTPIHDAPQAQRVVEKFGGVTRLWLLLVECGYTLTKDEIYGWIGGNGYFKSTTGGYIPHYAWDGILEAARLDGIFFHAEDFDPRPMIHYKVLPHDKRMVGQHEVVPPKIGRKRGTEQPQMKCKKDQL
jgi:hypothetical protein